MKLNYLKTFEELSDADIKAGDWFSVQGLWKKSERFFKNGQKYQCTEVNPLTYKDGEDGTEIYVGSNWIDKKFCKKEESGVNELQSSTLRSAAEKFGQHRSRKKWQIEKWIVRRNLHQSGELDFCLLDPGQKSSDRYTHEFEKFDWSVNNDNNEVSVELKFTTDGNKDFNLICPIFKDNKYITEHKWKLKKSDRIALLFHNRKSAFTFKNTILNRISKFIIETTEGEDDQFFNQILYRDLNKLNLNISIEDVDDILKSLQKIPVNMLWIDKWYLSDGTIDEVYKKLNDLNK